VTRNTAREARDIMTLCDVSGRTYDLDHSSAIVGGEALIRRVRGDDSILAKVYRKPQQEDDQWIRRLQERSSKLSSMLANPPRNPTAKQRHHAYAWPTTLLREPRSETVIGFLMPRLQGMREVADFYNPGARRRILPHFNYKYLMQTARNIAGVMNELHSKGYVIGDVSQKNMFVSDGALVTVLDTDSFQFRDPVSGFLYLCRVRTWGFIPPEVSAAGRDNIERTVHEDLFGLAVLAFHLLMEGVHPFACRFTGEGDAPHHQQNIVTGNFAHAPRSPEFSPPPLAPPFDMLAPELRTLFINSFVHGHERPAARPTARDWRDALDRAAKDLVPCTKNPHHYFGAHLGDACPWCARVQMGLPDSFPIEAPTPKPPRRRPVQVREADPISTPTSSSMAIRWVVFGVLFALVLLTLFLVSNNDSSSY
jgi:DNA-binding helix-hairpin-helix protein with protein kinase domain